MTAATRPSPCGSKEQPPAYALELAGDAAERLSRSRRLPSCSCRRQHRHMLAHSNHSAKRKNARGLPLWMPCGMIAATEMVCRRQCGIDREAFMMKRILTGVFACALAMSASAALAQAKPPLKLGGILDMSSLYADITGAGKTTAAKMAAEDFGGEVLGRKIEIIAADHLNKADLAANIARKHDRQPGRRDDLGRRGVRHGACRQRNLHKKHAARSSFSTAPDRSACPTKLADPIPCTMCSTPSRRPM